MQTCYAHLADTGSSLDVDTAIYPFDDFVNLMGFGQAQAFDDKWHTDAE